MAAAWAGPLSPRETVGCPIHNFSIQKRARGCPLCDHNAKDYRNTKTLHSHKYVYICIHIYASLLYLKMGESATRNMAGPAFLMKEPIADWYSHCVSAAAIKTLVMHPRYALLPNPTVKVALRHESADSEEDREGLGCHLGQGHRQMRQMYLLFNLVLCWIALATISCCCYEFTDILLLSSSSGVI